MAKTLKPLYGTPAAVTITLDALASSLTDGRESDTVDNSSNLYQSMRLCVGLGIGNGAPANDQAVHVWLVEWALDPLSQERAGGINNSPTGSDAAIADIPQTTPGLRYLGSLPVATAGTVRRGVFRVDNVPRKWSVIVQDYCGVALSPTEVARQNNTAYVLGDVVTVGNSHYYLCTVAGTSAGSDPENWSTSGGTSVDGGILTWIDCGLNHPNYVFYQPANPQLV